MYRNIFNVKENTQNSVFLACCDEVATVIMREEKFIFSAKLLFSEDLMFFS